MHMLADTRKKQAKIRQKVIAGKRKGML